MNKDFKTWMDGRRLRAIDVADALNVNAGKVYQWRHNGVPPLYRERVERYMVSVDKPERVLSAELMDAIRTIHSITRKVVVGERS